MTFPFSGLIVRFEERKGAPREPQRGEPTAELHVNLWDLKGGHCLDLGVMIENARYVVGLVIDLPWKVQPWGVVDLGTKLDNEKILTAVFNESVSYNSVSGANFARVKLGTGETPTEFTLLRIGTNKIKLEDIVAGDHTLTRVKIGLPATETASRQHDDDRIYVRLRFRDVPRAVFFTEFHPKDRNLLSSNSVTHLLDLRVNVRRGVPDEILLHDPGLNFPKISKLHVFVIVSRDTELPFHSEHYKGCRSLEDEAIWNYYLGLPGENSRQEQTIKGYLGYQWSSSQKSEGPPVKDLVALGRFVRTTSSAIKSYKFVSLMLWLGAFGSALWSVINSALHSMWQGGLDLMEAVRSALEPYPSLLWFAFILGPVVIIHVDAQSVRDRLSWAKRTVRTLRLNFKRWWNKV